MKKIVLVDFDGVIHRYSKGWVDGSIYDPPMAGAMGFLKTLACQPDMSIAIYSSRSKDPEQLQGMKEWFLKFYGDGTLPFDFPVEKPPAWITIDDRAFQFKGTFPTPSEIRNFKPWKCTDPFEVAPHLYSNEVACPCCGVIIYDNEFVSRLTTLRFIMGIPFYYTSFHRCRKYNEEVFGVDGSDHIYGRAGDILTIDWDSGIMHKFVKHALLLGLTVIPYLEKDGKEHAHVALGAHPEFKIGSYK